MRCVEGKPEAVTARPSVARDIGGKSEAATARSSIARCAEVQPDAATGRPFVARGTRSKLEAATARSSVAKGIQSESEISTARPFAAREQNEVDSAMELEILKCATTYFLNGEKPPTELLQTTIAEAAETASINYGVAEAIGWADGFEFPQAMLDSDLRCFIAAKLV